MIVLGFDTATPATAVALRLADGRALQARDDPGAGERPGHATRLLALVDSLLARAGLRFDQLERIAVGVGPGTFTGLRVGLATARGLAQSLSLELVGVSSLRALALAASAPQARSAGLDRAAGGQAHGEGAAPGANRAAGPQRAAGGQADGGGAAPTSTGAAGADAVSGVLSVLDARRGEAFAAAYAASAGSPDPVELVAPRALAPGWLGEVLATASQIAPGGRWIAVGDGAVRFRAELETLALDVPGDESPLHRVSAEAICQLALSAEPQPLEAVLPDYCRRPDAELALERTEAPAEGAFAEGRPAQKTARAAPAAGARA
ncbi:MAG TPA: tRNA (adenosine(37)-N6)-threonylcarbamoyltransferase complex dimerization subunit type 1 TsaB [Solirubrobacteraceae bacterium]|nr:tRNA (adenosine(37)-N6)-threonylcarbamoyltransferase complex dimerization subunit type 1 TsaB [Solirubrobacteraceae bacterium]